MISAAARPVRLPRLRVSTRHHERGEGHERRSVRNCSASIGQQDPGSRRLNASGRGGRLQIRRRRSGRGRRPIRLPAGPHACRLVLRGDRCERGRSTRSFPPRRAEAQPRRSPKRAIRACGRGESSKRPRKPRGCVTERRCACRHCNGGEGGIRTHEGSRPNGFQVRRLQPLSHLSILHYKRRFAPPATGCMLWITSHTNQLPVRPDRARSDS